MKIEKYSFGEMIIDGKTFTSDLKIIGGRIVSHWWRRDGHSLCLEDIDDALKEKIDTFVMGCGYSSVLKVPSSLKKALSERGITLIDLPTVKAVEKFNQTDDLKKASFGFHLTC